MSYYTYEWDEDVTRLKDYISDLEDIIAVGVDPTGCSQKEQELISGCYEHWSERN